jgi:hypothetical protein
LKDIRRINTSHRNHLKSIAYKDQRPLISMEVLKNSQEH